MTEQLFVTDKLIYTTQLLSCKIKVVNKETMFFFFLPVVSMIPYRFLVTVRFELTLFFK